MFRLERDKLFPQGQAITPLARRGRIADETGVDPWRVDLTEISEVEISTVFLGLDHNYLRRGPPILFETMIFGGRLDHPRNRCATWDEAKAMHAEAVRLVQSGPPACGQVRTASTRRIHHDDQVSAIHPALCRVR